MVSLKRSSFSEWKGKGEEASLAVKSHFLMATGKRSFREFERGGRNEEEQPSNFYHYTLEQMMRYLNNFDGYRMPKVGQVEVELRLGTMNDSNRFCPGVTRDFFEHYMVKMDASDRYERTETVETDYAYEMGAFNRLTVNEETGEISVMNKQKLFTSTDVANRFRYCTRISASTEIP